jgi:hypothetical protein
MAPIAISFVAFGLALVGTLLGSVIQRLAGRPSQLRLQGRRKAEHGGSSHTRRSVLGLLVASAKSTCDARESEINQITAYVILIDTCSRNMETRLKPRELRCAKQSQQSSIEFGEKGSLRRCGQLHSRHQPRAKRSINGSKSFNRATTLDVDSRSGYHGFGASAIPALSHLGSSIPGPFWQSCYSG